MPRETVIRSVRNGVSRVYRVTYADESPERREAIAFFENLDDRLWLMPEMDLPEFLHALPIEEANLYLQHNPLLQGYSGLVVWDGDLIDNDDLRRLQFLPELESVQMESDAITDEGVHHLRHLNRIDALVLSSAKVTDACFDVIAGLRTLTSLDLRGSPGLSRDKWETALQELGIRQFWLP